MGTKKINSGNTTIEVGTELDDMVTNVINKLFPEFKKEMEREFKAIHENAKKNWLIRRTKYGSPSKQTKRSIDKLKFNVSIQGGSIVGSVSNLADYAWAIKVGERSETFLPLNTNISNELLWKPVKKLNKQLSEKLLDEIIKLQVK